MDPKRESGRQSKATEEGAGSDGEEQGGEIGDQRKAEGIEPIGEAQSHVMTGRHRKRRELWRNWWGARAEEGKNEKQWLGRASHLKRRGQKIERKP